VNITRFSIVVPMMGFAIASAAAATLVQFAVTFRGPPPGINPIPIERVADALRTERSHSLSTGQQIIVSHSASIPAGRGDEVPSPPRDRAIAALIPDSPDSVRGFYKWPTSDPDGDILGSFTVAHRTQNRWVVASVSFGPVLSEWRWRTLQAMALTLLVLSVLAWAAAKRASLPLQRLADAASRARLGAPEPISLGGPREVQALCRAIESMQARILQQAESRTAMLAAMAHDLGTPLSRLAFWIEQLPETARDRAAADIDEMRAMLGATLRFARDDRTRGDPMRLDLGSLIESLADDLSVAGMPVTVQPGPRAVVTGDAPALRRLFANLIENAIRYGQTAEIGWTTARGWADVTVDDQGPGFDPARADSLFAPFVRGETSRNRATGGTGLGLAIVRSITEAHDGEVTLENRDGGGGRVRVRLPAER
jgi:two-component system, OmpR family, sensor kinase